MNRIWPRILLLILVLTGSGLVAAERTAAQAAAGSSGSSESVTVYLHRIVLLEDPELSLGQVASIFGPDPVLSRTLAQLPLGPAPTRPTLLPASVIRERIAAAAVEAVVIGGRIAVLPARAVPQDQQWFYSALLDFVAAQDAFERGRIEIDLLSSPLLLEDSGYAAADGGLATGWEDRILFQAGGSPYGSGFRTTLTSQKIPAGTMQVSYKLLAPAGDPEHAGLGGFRGLEGTFRIWIHHFLPVAWAAENIPANQPLTAERLSYREEDVSILQSAFVLQGEELHGYKTLSLIRRGERIDGRRLQRILAVRAGDRLQITFIRPGLQVSLPGRALRSGSIGDIIDVRPEAAAKRFRGRISADGEVLVENR